MEQFCFYATVEVSVPVGYFAKNCPNQEGFIKGILQYFSDLEFSGQENVYYSKFMYRGSLLEFLMKIWAYPEYREMTQKVARANKKIFDEFLGHILTDLNFCVDESYNDIPKFKDLFEKGEDKLDDEERSSMEHFKEKIKNWFQNARDLLKVLVFLTSIFPEEFSGDDWRRKFVLILNHYASKFLTQNFKKLQMRVVTFGSVSKVNAFKVLGINVLETIKQILRVYLNVSDIEKILEEIVKDERSYKDNLLIDLGKTSIKKNLLLQNDILKLEKLISQLRTLSTKASDLKAMLDDFPEEFMCQLTYELMKDPVKLPASQTIVDRSSIKQHISLNGTSDPFNRQPLKLEDCIELPELKAKINSWIEVQMNETKGKVDIQSSMIDDDEDDTVFEDVDEVDDRSKVYDKRF